jgi:hypothetical protein
LSGAELGLVERSTAIEDAEVHQLPRIRLFLANLWEWVNGDKEGSLDEAGTPFLDELGHFFGWDGGDLDARGLD